jgi:hypothetical protein
MQAQPVQDIQRAATFSTGNSLEQTKEGCDSEPVCLRGRRAMVPPAVSGGWYAET